MLFAPMPVLVIVLLLVAAAGAAASPQQAQPATPAPASADEKKTDETPRGWTDIGFVSVDGGYHRRSASFSDSFSFPQYAEQATINTQYPQKDGPTFNVGWTFRVWNHLGGGLAVSGFNRTTTGAVNGLIPHPLLPSAPRAVTGASQVERSETGVHVHVSYVIPIRQNLLLSLDGGPSYFSVKQSLVDSVQIEESASNITPALLPLEPSEVKSSAIGFNTGVDVGYYFTRAVGIGAMARFSRGIVPLPVRGRTVSTNAGGFQVGVGVRFRIPKTVKTKSPGKPPTKPVVPGPIKKGR